MLAHQEMDLDGQAELAGDDLRRLQGPGIGAGDQPLDGMGRQGQGCGPGLALALLGQPGIGDAGIHPRGVEGDIELGLAVAQEDHGDTWIGRGQRRRQAGRIGAACPSAGNSLCKVG